MGGDGAGNDEAEGEEVAEAAAEETEGGDEGESAGADAGLIHTHRILAGLEMIRAHQGRR